MKSLFPLIASIAICCGQDIDLTGYTLTFEDNFDVLSATNNNLHSKGSNTWFQFPPYGISGGYSKSYWSVYSMSVEGGILKDVAYYHAPFGIWYTGQLASMDEQKSGFAQKYGYFEARMKMPNAGTGAWPSFWMMSENSIPDNRGKRLEVDILEWYGNNPAVARQSVHPWNDDGSQLAGGYGTSYSVPGGNASADFHIYGVKIDPANITFFVDGVQTGQTSTPSDYLGPMYLMIAYALGGGWPLSGDPFPSHGTSTLLVDWVRVYSLPDAVSSPKNLHVVK